jgi:RHS repeat-associated protein
VVDRTLKDPYQYGPTASQTLHGVSLEARVVNAAVTTARTALDAGRGWRTTRTTNAFVSDRSGRLDRVDNEGDTATTADDQCTRYTYATNAAGTMLNSLARVETVAVNCAATPNRAVDVISDVRTWYDGATSFGTTLTRGLATRVEKLADWNAGNPTYVTESRASYDAHGRPVETFDALGRRTATVYTPPTGGPVTRTDVTNAMSWTAVSEQDPAWGVSTRVTDANNVRALTTYDPLGRVSAVWLAGRQSPALPDIAYEYNVRADGPTVLTAKKLNTAGTGHIAAYTLYDGLLRVRQKQVPAVGGGRMIVETVYDSRGLVNKERHGYFNAAAPSSALFKPSGDVAVPSQTVMTYDGAERIDVAALQVDAVQKWRSKTSYGGDHTRVEVPAGAPAVAEWTDARGHIVKTRQYQSNLPTGAYDETVRTYTRAGDLASVRDGAGTTWSYGYDQRRRKVRDEDPDKGVVTYTYDASDQILTMKDARNVTVAFVYDTLGRKTATHLGTPSGRKLTSWTYDTLAKGKLTSWTRFDDAGNAYMSELTQYNSRYQPLGTKTTVPAVEGALAGEYTTAQTYNVDGSVATSAMPTKSGAASFGGLGAETLTYGYNSLGLPSTVSGLATYVTATEYRQDGRLAAIHSSGGPSRDVIQYWSYEHGTGRLAEHQVLADFAPVVAADTFYGYDPAGNITSIKERIAQYSAGPDDTQCFAHDHLRRLTTAWTPATGDCAPAPTTAGVGGPAAYLRTYTYAANGNRMSETEHRAGGNTTRTLTYPGATSARPHAVATLSTATPGGTSTSTYTYDAVGNTTKRPGATGEQTLTWNAEGRLAGITENGATTEVVYDPEGGRLTQRDPAGRTLYLNGAQYRATAGGAVSVSRLYGHGEAGLVASREASTGLSWQATDHQGSSEYAFKASDMSLTRRRFAPFGRLRGSSPTWSNPFGYVGGEHDAAGTVHLGAREYDPNLGRFLTVDPVMDVADPQSWQGYAYANNTPVTGSDPSGLRVCLEVCGGPDDKMMQQQIRETKKRQRAEQEKLCPRNIPREDCFGEYKPSLKGIKDQKVYKNGTRLVIYNSGRVEINGYILPEDIPDPYALAEATDDMAPQVKRDSRYGGDEYVVRGIAIGCEKMGRGCSLNFRRAVNEDLMEMQGPPPPMGTISVCGTAGAAGYLFNLSGSVCAGMDYKGFFLTATGAGPGPPSDQSGQGSGHGAGGSYGLGGGNRGVGGGLGIGVQVTDAQDKDGLKGEFEFVGGSGGPAEVEYAEGGGVHSYYGGYSKGTPSASAGTSNTKVSGYAPGWVAATLCALCFMF